MASTASTPIATDNAAELRRRIGDDATATFEDDPTFIDSNPGAGGSSENLPEQQARDTDDTEDSEEEADDEEDLDDEDDDIEDDDIEDDEEDDEELEDDDEDFEDDDEDEDDIEDDAEEASAAAIQSRAASLGEDDDAGDVASGVSEDEFTDDDMDTDRVAVPIAGFIPEQGSEARL